MIELQMNRIPKAPVVRRVLAPIALALLVSAALAQPVAAAEAKPAGKGPVKVFILAGQSNMEGHAKVETFDYIGDNQATAPILKEMRNADGTPRVCDNVWISYLTGGKDGNGEGTGKLTAGFGARRDPTQPGGKIGPEFTFGIYMSKAVKEPILLIKAAWGGKSLHTDFRPPSAGPYVFNELELKKEKNTTPEAKQQKADATGKYYRYTVEHVKAVLKDIKRVYPDYDEKQGFELAGFVWLQGFNDMVNHDVYPPLPEHKEGNYAKYSEWLADFIRDVRKDLNAPKMPFVIGVMGVGGMSETNPGNLAFREAMAAPASLPEFKGNVAAVRTAPFLDESLLAIEKKREKCKQQRQGLGRKVKDGQMTKAEADKAAKEFEAKLITPEEEALFKRAASNAGYHYLGCSKTFALMGKNFAEAMIQMQKK
jgi:hypothetical protein